MSKLPQHRSDHESQIFYVVQENVAEPRQKHLQQVNKTLSEGEYRCPPPCAASEEGAQQTEPWALEELHNHLHVHSSLSSLSEQVGGMWPSGEQPEPRACSQPAQKNSQRFWKPFLQELHHSLTSLACGSGGITTNTGAVWV